MTDAPIFVLASNAGFVRQLGAALASLGSTQPAGHVFIVHDGLDDDDRHRLRLSARPLDVEFLEVRPERFEGLHTSERLTTATLFRLALPDLLPAEVERVLYLDADVIVRHDLRPLHDLDLGGHLVGAVHDAASPWLFMVPGLPWRELDRAPSTPALNAGVMVVPLQAWRDGEVPELCSALLASHRLHFADQCALNLVIEGDVAFAHPRYNVQAHHYAANSMSLAVEPLGAVDDAITDPAVVHFVHAHLGRPWYGWCDHPRRGEWFDALDRTPWAGWRPRPDGRWTKGGRRVRAASDLLLHGFARPHRSPMATATERSEASGVRGQ